MLPCHTTLLNVPPLVVQARGFSHQHALNVCVSLRSSDLLDARSVRATRNDKHALRARQQLVGNLRRSASERAASRTAHLVNDERTTAWTPYRCSAFCAFGTRSALSVSSLNDTTYEDGAHWLRRLPVTTACQHRTASLRACAATIDAHRCCAPNSFGTGCRWTDRPPSVPALKLGSD
jgi:hypothetical protein